MKGYMVLLIKLGLEIYWKVMLRECLSGVVLIVIYLFFICYWSIVLSIVVSSIFILGF